MDEKVGHRAKGITHVKEGHGKRKAGIVKNRANGKDVFHSATYARYRKPFCKDGLMMLFCRRNFQVSWQGFYGTVWRPQG